MALLPEKLFWELFKYVPRLVVDDVVINGKSEILLVKRKTLPFKGSWCLPSGFVEKGDTVEKTALKECFEETGIKAEIVSLVGVYSDPMRDPMGHLVSICFLLRPVKNTQPTDSDETSNVQFVPLNKMPKLIADNNKMVEDALKIFKEKAGANIRRQSNNIKGAKC